MTDWSSGIETRNYSIRRVTDSHNLAGLLVMTLVLSVLAGVLIMYAWQRSQIVELGYQSQRLMELEQNLLRVERTLMLEAETLKDPARIDSDRQERPGDEPIAPAPDDPWGPSRTSIGTGHPSWLWPKRPGPATTQCAWRQPTSSPLPSGMTEL